MFHDLSRESLLDLLLELAPERTSVEIVISGDDGPARLGVSHGKLVHAECGHERGPIAFERILRLQRGQCEVVEALRATDRTLDLPITVQNLERYRSGGVGSSLNGFGKKTLLQFSSQAPRASEASRSSARPPAGRRGKLIGTGYSSAPPPGTGEEVVTMPPSARVPRTTSQRPPPVAPVAQRRGHGATNARRSDRPPPRQTDPLDPDTGPVPSSRLDKSSLARLEELNEALSSTQNPLPERDEPPPRQDELDRESRDDASLPRVGRYEVLARLKSGGMGSIYLCRLSGSAGFQRLFAMKVLHQHLTEQQEALDLFFSEARLLAQLHHPNIVGIVDVGSPVQPYLVLDYVEGGSFKDLLKASGLALEPGVVLSIVLDALQGLSAAHQLRSEHGQLLGLVHNDITPHNLLVGIDGTCRVTDFGIAKEGEHSPVSQTRGKPSFIAPERILRHEVDQRADLFSMGVVLYQGLTGTDPFLGATAEETLRNVLERTVPPPSEVGLRPPPTLDWFCLKALAKDPNERFQSAEEMALLLRRAAAREDLLVAPSTVAQWVRTVLAGPLEARRAATQRGATLEEGRKRPITIPPGVTPAPPEAAPVPASASSESDEFQDKTEVLSTPAPAPAPTPPTRRNTVLYALLGLTLVALLLVLAFPERVQGILRKEAQRPPSSEEAWVRRQADMAQQGPGDTKTLEPQRGSDEAGSERTAGDDAVDAAAEPKIHIAPVTREPKP